MNQLFLCLCLLFSPMPLWADEEVTISEPYPQLLAMPEYIYQDYLIAYDRVFAEEAVPYWWAVGLSTVALVATDDKWISESQRFANSMGISSEDKTTTLIEYQGLQIFRGPTDLGSFMYFLGDGWTHAAIAAGFLATGAWVDDHKAYSVGFQLIEGMISTTIATQTLKHLTGRESPSHATTATGRWDFFPDQVAYFNNIPAYDAYPSGHVAVATMTLTVIQKNYAEITWIMPTGITLVSLLSFQMMNNEAHWASDYPLAIALGYTFGSIAYERGLETAAETTAAGELMWLPLVSNNEIGLGLRYDF